MPANEVGIGFYKSIKIKSISSQESNCYIEILKTGSIIHILKKKDYPRYKYITVKRGINKNDLVFYVNKFHEKYEKEKVFETDKLKLIENIIKISELKIKPYYYKPIKHTQHYFTLIHPNSILKNYNYQSYLFEGYEVITITANGFDQLVTIRQPPKNNVDITKLFKGDLIKLYNKFLKETKQ